jgi:hypothetical protein
MSSNSNDGGGAVIVLAIVGVILYFTFLFLFALGVFAAVILTILCLLAWNRPLRFFGYVLEPHEARVFVGRGIAGMILVPLFAAFAGWFFEFQVPPELWSYLIIGGYALGSVGVEYQNAKHGEERLFVRGNDVVSMSLPPQAPVRVLPSNRARPEVSPEDTGFEFATWDDEERNGQEGR